MDGGAYSPWPEEPDEGEGADGASQSGAKVALIVVITLLLGVFLSVSRLGVPRLEESGELSNACLGSAGTTRCDPK